MLSHSYIQDLFAERIGGKLYGKSTELYKFAKIKLAKSEAILEKPHLDIIDMGVGEPDDMAFPEIVSALQLEAALPENRTYADNGCREFKAAVAHYMLNLFNVKLNPDTNIIHSIGSKSALSILPTCFINPGDVALMTIPGYNIFATHTRYLGGEVFNLPLTEDNHYLPDLNAIPNEIVERAKVLVLNYPNNPTGASAPLEFYRDAIAWARQNEIIIIQDAAYSALVYDGVYRSIFQVPEAMENCIEVHSLSKSFNMTGWRMGWVCGNPLIIKAYGDVKNNTDSGQFLAIQKAAALALYTPQITDKIMKKYSRRMHLLMGALSELGFIVSMPKGSFFLYTKAPRSAKRGSEITHFSNAEDFSQWLIREHLISTVPWDDTEAGIRFSVTFHAPSPVEEMYVVDEIKARLQNYIFTF